MECIIACKQKHFYDQVLVRNEVFLLEQHVPVEEEIDKLDGEAVQFIAYDNDQPIGSARLRIFDNKGKVERVCVVKSYRKKGVGRLIMNTVEKYILDNTDIKKVMLNAQMTALPFYRRLGFHEYGEIFLDAFIEHKAMEKYLK